MTSPSSSTPNTCRRLLPPVNRKSLSPPHFLANLNSVRKDRRNGCVFWEIIDFLGFVMDTSRAVESYWRSRMVDAVTSDEDKVAPVYKLEEMCDLLRSSHASTVKEFSEFILKRLENKSPIVKQKALRLIKYAVGKSGSEFGREMQRNSVAVRNLFHYKGHPDPLKGEALNKAVWDTVHETIAAMFSEDNSSKSAATESIKQTH